LFFWILSSHCSVSLTTTSAGKGSFQRFKGRSILNPTQRQRRHCCSDHASSSWALYATKKSKCTATATGIQNKDEQLPGDRRRFLLSAPWIVFLAPKVAQARGLVRFPIKDNQLLNSYHFLHAGTSLLEEEGIWSTNPLFLTNREDALSSRGQDEVQAACEAIKDTNSFPTIVKYSLAASSMDSANIVGRELNIGRDRLVPEFTFMDPRAVGQWDMLSKQLEEPAVWAMDVDEAGDCGLGGRPPPNEDGTPHETLADQSIRLRQLLSILETLYSGDTILLVFPDGTGPALLSAMMAGIPYNRVHELEFAPGEIRLNVTRDSVLELWKTKQGDTAYAGLVDKGRKRLKTLRETNEFVNMKDQKIEAERLAIEQRKVEKNMERDMEEQQERQKIVERQQQIAESQEKQRQQELQKKSERQQRVAASQQQQKSNGSFSLPPAALGLVGVAVVGSVAAQMVGGDGDDTSGASPSTSSATADPEPLSAELDEPVLTNGTATADPEPSSAELGEPVLTNGSLHSSTQTEASIPPGSAEQRVNGDTKSIFDEGPSQPENPIDAAEKAMQDYLDEDDGGDAWLQSMAEIIQESDDEGTE
jgi:broad specificity phosphatase PhoE